jgi:ATP-dependent helicase/nuclease subunit B
MANIYNIPFSVPFLPTIAKILIQQSKESRVLLANYTILVNNTRIIKALQTQFLQHANSKAIILPKIISIDDLQSSIFYEIIKHEDLLAVYSNFLSKKIITKNQRSFILSKLVQKKDPHIKLNTAIKIAQDLGNFIDESYFNEADLNKLETVVDDNLSIYWQETLKFLNIITAYWPQYLEQNNAMDEAKKELLHINILSQLLKKQNIEDKNWQNNNPFIALNITSSYPVINNLLETIKAFETSKIFFWGLDLEHYNQNKTNTKLLDVVKINLKAIHPQALLYNTLNSIKANMEEIIEPILQSNKDAIINSLWSKNINTNFKHQEILDFAENISILNAESEEEEAKGIALMLRKFLQDAKTDKSLTVGVICNNNNLIKRINLQLSKWGIDINNYLGENLAEFKNAEFFILIGKVLENNFAPTDFLSLLKHNFFNINNFEYNKLEIVDFLDEHIFRQKFTKYSIDEYIKKTQDLDLLFLKPDIAIIQKNTIEFLNTIKELFSEIQGLIVKDKTKDFSVLLLKHIQLAQKISQSKEDGAISDLWSNQEGKDLAQVLTNLVQNSSILGGVDLLNYNLIVRNMIALKSVYYTALKSKRLFLYGGLQSVLMHHSVVIFSNFNDTSFPNISVDNPFFNRSILKSLGFNLDISLSQQANLFCQVLGSKQVIITRANKNTTGQAQTPSRWLIKLQTFLNYYITNINQSSQKESNQSTSYNFFNNFLTQPLGINDMSSIIDKMLEDTALNIATIKQPKAYINASKMPKKIATTVLENLKRNPYAFFITKILKISPMDEIKSDIQQNTIGEYIHLSLEQFFKHKNITKLLNNLDDSKQELTNIAYKNMSFLFYDIGFKIFKWNLVVYQLHKTLDYIHSLATKQGANIFIEQEAEFVLKINNINVKITGRADNIIVNTLDNCAQIFDYKTTNTDTYKDHFLQLPMLSYMLLNKHFKNINMENFKEIKASYLFLPKNFSLNLVEKSFKDYLIKTTKDKNIDSIQVVNNFDEEVVKILSPYFSENKNNLISFEFLAQNIKNIYDTEKYFARFNEWNQNLDLEIEEDDDEDIDNDISEEEI